MFHQFSSLLRNALVGWIAAVILVSSALASDVALVNTDGDKVAIKGYDTVAYFVDGHPVKGDSKYEYVWRGARWRFASAAHRDLFGSAPQSYAPQFGGFCAGAMALGGTTVPADPQAWAIVDGKLYLNADKSYIAEWRKKAAANIKMANQQWAELQGNRRH